MLDSSSGLTSSLDSADSASRPFRGAAVLDRRLTAYGLLSVASLLVLTAATGYWSGFTPLADDASSHIATIATLAGRIQAGGGWWSTDYNMGFPMALYYQPLPHVVSAYCTLPFGGAPAADEVFKFFTALMIVAQPWAIYLGLRRFGLRPWTAAIAGFLAPFLPDGISFGYHAWATLKVGLYTQAWGNVAFPLALGELARVARGQGRVSTTMAACAFTASTHMFYAIALVVPVCLFVVIGLQWRKAIPQLLAAGVGAVAVLSGWLFALTTTQAYMGGWPFGRASRVNGYGFGEVFRRITSGTLLDGEADRAAGVASMFADGEAPMLTFVATVGLVALVVRLFRARPDLRTPAAFLLVLTAWSLFGVIGRASFGGWIDLYPLHKNVQLFRYGAVLQFCGLAFAAVGLGVITRELAKASAAIAAIALVALVTWPVVDGMHQLRDGFRTIETTRHFRPAAYFDAVEAIAELPDGGRLYVGKRGELRGHYHSGLMAWTTQRPVAQSYGVGLHDSLHFYTLEYFHLDARNADVLAELFDFRWLLYGDDVFPTEAELLEDPEAESAIAGLNAQPPLWESDGYHLAPLPGSEHSVVLMREAERRVGSPRTERASIRAWMAGNGPATGQTVVVDVPDPRDRAALVGSPQRIAPMVFPSASTPPSGAILSSNHVGSTFRTEVRLDEPALVVMKIGYHPFWRVRRNGQPVDAVFAYPGFIAVECGTGTHEITGYFQWPLAARVLTWLAPLPLLIALRCERGLKRRRRA